MSYFIQQNNRSAGHQQVGGSDSSSVARALGEGADLVSGEKNIYATRSIPVNIFEDIKFNAEAVAAPNSRASVIEGSLADQPSNAKRNVYDTLIDLVRIPYDFTVRAFKSDWKVAACSLVAATPANLVTAFAVVYSAPWLESVFGGEHTAGFGLATTAAAIVVGYGLYLTSFYSLMAYKDRALFRDSEDRFDRKAFLSVMLIDFCLHIPSDIYTIARMGAVQMGCYQTGAFNLFWSVLIGQTVNDLPDSIKEVLYWRGAKELYEAARQRENGKELGIIGAISHAISLARRGGYNLETQPANADVIDAIEGEASGQKVA